MREGELVLTDDMRVPHNLEAARVTEIERRITRLEGMVLAILADDRAGAVERQERKQFVSNKPNHARAR